MPGIMSCDIPGEGDAVGICIPGIMSCDGLGEGDAVGICIPGIMSCNGFGEGDAVGICIPGIISCEGVCEVLGLLLVLLFVAARRGFVRGFFFRGALLAFGIFIPGILLMSCPSCCGSALTLTANIRASALSVRSALLQLLGLFMFFPSGVLKANSDKCSQIEKVD